MNKNFNKVKSTRNSKGLFTVRYGMSTGWGDRIDGWAIEISGNRAEGFARIGLAIDENADQFKTLYNQYLNADVNQSASFFRKLVTRDIRDKNRPPHRTVEREVAKLTLMQLSGQDAITHPSVVHNLVQICAVHSPSIQSGEFLLAKEALSVDVL